MIYYEQKTVLQERHNNITGVNFMVISTKLYVPVFSLPIDDNIKILENIKQAFKRKTFWKKLDLK